MTTQLTVIKTTSDGCKRMSYNGIDFWVNQNGMIAQTDNWSVAAQLEKAGLATHKFYKHCYGHTSYYMKHL